MSLDFSGQVVLLGILRFKHRLLGRRCAACDESIDLRHQLIQLAVHMDA